jgi:hypothetical protein
LKLKKKKGGFMKTRGMKRLICGIIIMGLTAGAYAVKVNRTLVDANGNLIDEIIVDGRPPKVLPEPNRDLPKEKVPGVINYLDNVPSYSWCYGCSATSVAMQAGYFDNNGYPDFYTGPANGGVQPMTNAVWNAQASHTDTAECPVSASAQNVDSRSIKGHADDYWSSYLSTVDPYYGNWTQHVISDGQPCTGDYMGTNQWYNFQNEDGSTTFYNYTNGSPLYDYTGCEPGGRDGCHGMRLFYEACGATVLSNFSQYIYGYNGNTIGFTYAQFKTEIDNGNPVLIQVEGHTMLGYGYNDTGSLVYLRDTWDQNTAVGSHTMVWGGSYSTMAHYAVTVIRLEAPVIELGIPQNVASTVTGSSLSVSWSAVSGATGYVVYSADDPYGTFGIDNSGSFNGTIWTTSIVNQKKFYYVIATNAKTRVYNELKVSRDPE